MTDVIGKDAKKPNPALEPAGCAARRVEHHGDTSARAKYDISWPTVIRVAR